MRASEGDNIVQEGKENHHTSAHHIPSSVFPTNSVKRNLLDCSFHTGYLINIRLSAFPTFSPFLFSSYFFFFSHQLIRHLFFLLISSSLHLNPILFSHLHLLNSISPTVFGGFCLFAMQSTFAYATDGPSSRLFEIFHYVFPIALFFCFAGSMAFAICSLHTLRPPTRKIYKPAIAWLSVGVIGTYVVEAVTLIVHSLLEKGWWAPENQIVSTTLKHKTLANCLRFIHSHPSSSGVLLPEFLSILPLQPGTSFRSSGLWL